MPRKKKISEEVMFVVKVGFNIIVDRKKDPAGVRFEPDENKVLTINDLPKGRREPELLEHLAEMGAIEFVKGPKPAAAEEAADD